MNLGNTPANNGQGQPAQQPGQPAQQPGQPGGLNAAAAAGALGSGPGGAGTQGGVNIPMQNLGQNPLTQPLIPGQNAPGWRDRMPDLTPLANFARGIPAATSTLATNTVALGGRLVSATGQQITNAATSFSNGTKQLLDPLARAALSPGKNPDLSKRTTTYSSLLYGETRSTIREPRTKAEKSDDVRAAMTNPATQKLTAALQATLMPGTSSRREAVSLARVHLDSFADRLARSATVLTALANRDSRQDLHRLTNADLTPTQFSKTAAIVRAASKVGPLKAGYQDRQVDTLASSPEAHIDQGISTLNLMRESRTFEDSLGMRSQPTVVEVPDRSGLRRAQVNVGRSRTEARTALDGFEQSYKDFLTDDLGLRKPLHATYTDRITEIADLDTQPARRTALHAEVMAKATAERHLDVALDAITLPADRTAIEGALNAIQRDNTNPTHADRHVTAFIDQLTSRDAHTLGERDGAREFLTKFAEVKGPPLAEVLRVHKEAFRDAWSPAPAAANDPVGKWENNRAQDMEKINAELTTMAQHVRAAQRTGVLEERLAEVFPRDAASGASARQALEVMNNFERSYQALRDRPLGQPVDAQDKLNVKLAKCVLDNGADVKFLAKELKSVQETYAARLANSPDMLKVLQGGSTGASYDPVEQRANARTRVDNLRVAIAAADNTYTPSTSDYSTVAVDNDVVTAKALAAHPTTSPAHAAALKQHVFLAENYVRQANSNVPADLLRQLGDNDARCGTDALVTENIALYGNGAVTAGAKITGPLSLNGALETTQSTQFPTRFNPWVRNSVESSLVLQESSAYSIKAITDLRTKVYKGTLKGALAIGLADDEHIQKGFALAPGGNVGYERVTIENARPGLACMVHKAPVLDGTASNAKVSGATHIAINDTVNQALFSTQTVPNVTTVANPGVDGWENLSQFLAATERTTIEPLRQRKEVTTTLSFGYGGSGGMSVSGSEPSSGPHRATMAGRPVAVSAEEKFSHSFRDETLITPTVQKLTSSDTFSDTRSASAGASFRAGYSLTTDLGAAEKASTAADLAASTARTALGPDHVFTKGLEKAAEGLDNAASRVPRVRFTTSLDVAKAGHGIERNREYRELYKRVVRDQFGNEIPSMVRDSKTSTDGRLLVNNLVNEIGLVNATMSQRIDDGGGTMTPLEKETLTKLLCLSTIASHYRNAGTLGDGTPNDNLTINVTASLSPAAAARHAAMKTGLGDESARADLLDNSMNYTTIGAAGGFKNQDTSAMVKMLMSRSKRSTSSAQSAGYPSGTDVFTRAEALQFRTLLDQDDLRDVRDALDTVGMGDPVRLWDEYEALKPGPVAPTNP